MGLVPNRATGCLFCGNEEGRFDSTEHVVLKTLGNSVKTGLVEEEIVIPPGEICDKCNGQRLQRYDNALAGWPPISVFRSLGLIANRRGNLVDAVKGTAWDLQLDPDDPRLFNLSFEAETNASSRRDDVARSLCKVALETCWLDDPADARSSRWDLIAAAAIGGALPPDIALGLVQPASPSEIDFRPRTRVMVDPDSASLRFACRLEVVGLELLLFVGLRPFVLPSTTWWTLSEATGALEGPGLMYGTFRGMAERSQRIYEDAAEPSRKSSRLPASRPGTEIRVLRSKDPGSRR
jgi:hypothetical protein